MTVTSIRELIDGAMEGVAIAVCDRCRGWGKVGLPSCCTQCPECRGSGRTTTNELESVHA